MSDGGRGEGVRGWVFIGVRVKGEGVSKWVSVSVGGRVKGLGMDSC